MADKMISQKFDESFQIPANRKMGLSVTKIENFFQCQEMFKAKYIDKVVPFVETDAKLKGKKIHEWCEFIINNGLSVLEEAPVQFINEFTKGILKKVLEAPGTKQAEFMLGLDLNLTKATKINKAWDKQIDGQPFGIVLAIDARIVNEIYTTHLDFKSGKVYKPFEGKSPKYIQQTEVEKAIQAKRLQMDVYALAEFIYNPECQYIKSIYTFTEHGETFPIFYSRQEDEARIRDYLSKAIRHIWFHIEAWQQGSLACTNVTPLCGWCAVREKCKPYNQRLGAN